MLVHVRHGMEGIDTHGGGVVRYGMFGTHETTVVCIYDPAKTFVSEYVVIGLIQ